MSPLQTRRTKQKAAIRETLQRAERPLSVPEILAEASRGADGLGVATVYRSIAALLEEDWITAVEIAGEPVRYELAGKTHHHHFHCESCQRVFDIDGCIADLGSLVPPQFRVRDHAVTIYGTCSGCDGGFAASGG